MSRKTEVRADFAGEERTFNLAPIGCIKRLQDACDAGPQYTLALLQSGQWRLEHLREPLLQGLIGGGMAQREAQALLEKWFDPEPKIQFVPVACSVLLGWLVGADEGEEEGAGEPKGEETGSRPSPEGKSTSAQSTEPALS